MAKAAPQTTAAPLTPEQVRQRVGESGLSPDDLGWRWDLGGAAQPGGVPDFLRDEVWQHSRRDGGFDGAHDAECAQVAAAIRRDPALVRLIWQAFWRTYQSPERRPLKAWPTLEPLLGEQAGYFYYLVALAGIPLTQAYHRRLGLPEGVTASTVQQARVESVPYYSGAHHGRFGVDFPQLEWLSHYTRERYFRLGRLEFWLEPNRNCPARVYRHRATGRVVALAPDGMMFAADGSVYADPAERRPGTGWTASFRADRDAWCGHVISPFGQGTRWQVRLTRSEWQETLRPGDLCLTLHIPNGGGLTPAACRDSMLRALDFFPRHFPDSLPRGLVSVSWLFNNQLRQAFPAEANVVHF
ncbi:MAG: acyltransferase domain-containing protein, partial [Lentisphaeria bacterium]|nr:acyltransferase domain-containing protein [Lentisphaeria bacterium]